MSVGAGGPITVGAYGVYVDVLMLTVEHVKFLSIKVIWKGFGLEGVFTSCHSAGIFFFNIVCDAHIVTDYPPRCSWQDLQSLKIS